jgi:hypothetical protein
MEVCKVYRRQENERQIHGSWTDITLQFDEGTGRAMIVKRVGNGSQLQNVDSELSTYRNLDRGRSCLPQKTDLL